MAFLSKWGCMVFLIPLACVYILFYPSEIRTDLGEPGFEPDKVNNQSEEDGPSFFEVFNHECFLGPAYLYVNDKSGRWAESCAS